MPNGAKEGTAIVTKTISSIEEFGLEIASSATTDQWNCNQQPMKDQLTSDVILASSQSKPKSTRSKRCIGSCACW